MKIDHGVKFAAFRDGMIELVELFPTGRRHLSLRCSPLLVASLPFSSLVAKHFDLAIAAMRGWCVRVSVRRWVLVRVHLDMQRQSFHAFLTGEVGAQTLHGHVDLRRGFEWVPINGNRIVRNFFYAAHQSHAVLRVKFVVGSSFIERQRREYVA